MNFDTPAAQPDQIVIDTPPLYLPMADEDIIVLLNEAEQKAKAAKTKDKIDDRRKDNIRFYLGDQVDTSMLDMRYQMAHVDNIAGQSLDDQIKLASSKIPDIYVSPPDAQQYNLETARDLQQWLRERIDNSTIKRLIKNGLRDLNLELIAIIKPRWDYAGADFVFELIRPEDMLFGEGSLVLEDGFSIDGVPVTFQYVEEPTNVVLAKFKKKAEELKAAIAQKANNNELPSRIRYTEAHFRWYDQQGRLNEAVTWRYGNVILEAMKEPYYDYDNPKINYFDRPRKPYILLSYKNMGQGVYEATSTFEQAKPLNKIINKRRRQITEISDRAVPKMAFAGGAIDAEVARNISPSPNQGIMLNDAIDDIRKAFAVIPATPPNPILFNDLTDMRQRVQSMFAVSGNGAAQQASSASGISKQISRESDLVTSDDIGEIVVERVVGEMVQWAMQFARLFYDDDRPPLRTTNEEGDTKFTELSRKKIETDIQTVVKASTNDKATRRDDAIQQLTGKVTDPYTFFEDIDSPNPKERTKRLIQFIKSQVAGDWTGYLAAIDIDLDQDQASEEDAMRDIEFIASGGQPTVDKVPSPAYVATLLAYISDPSPQAEFSQLDEQGKQRLNQHIAAVKQKVKHEATIQQGGGADQAGGAPGQPPQPGQPPGPAGAVAGMPGVAPPPAPFQPQVDTSTQWGGNPQPPNLANLSRRVMPAPAGPAPAGVPV